MIKNNPSQFLAPHMRAAVEELEGIIRGRFPDAAFRVERSPEDRGVVHLMAEVDVEDQDDVLDLVVDRILAFQLEHDLPVHVIPVQPRHHQLEASHVARSARELGQTDVAE